MRRVWPPSEAAQADYETLREAAQRGEMLLSPAARRFERRGLAGLIAWPVSEPVYCGQLTGAVRLPWSPRLDPRLETLAAGFELLLSIRADSQLTIQEA